MGVILQWFQKSSLGIAHNLMKEVIPVQPGSPVIHKYFGGFVANSNVIDGSRSAHSLVWSTFPAGKFGTIRKPRRRCNGNEVI